MVNIGIYAAMVKQAVSQNGQIILQVTALKTKCQRKAQQALYMRLNLPYAEGNAGGYKIRPLHFEKRKNMKKIIVLLTGFY